MGECCPALQHSAPLRTPPLNMDSRLVFPAALLLLFCLVDSGAGIKCYQCNSYEQALCADPFFHSDNGEAKSGREFLDDCPADTADKKHFCRKIYQNVRGDVRVIRSCGWVPDSKGRECYTTVLEEYNTEVCACDKDECNPASLSSISVITVLSAVVLGYLIH